jgi:hypothetical protein
VRTLGVGSFVLTLVACRLAFAQTADDAPMVQVEPPATAAAPPPPAPPVSPVASGDTPPPPPRPGLYTHDGFYLRYSLGPGLYRVGPGSSPGALVEGATVSGLWASEILAIGGTLPHGVVLAGASSAVVSKNAVVANYGLLVDWFPDPRAGWHIGAQLGLGLVRDAEYYSAVDATPYGPPTPNDFALGLGVSLIGGYDAWVTPQFSMGINLIAMTTALARQTFQGDSTTYSLTPVAGGIMVSVLYH